MSANSARFPRSKRPSGPAGSAQSELLQALERVLQSPGVDDPAVADAGMVWGLDQPSTPADQFADRP